MKLDHPPATAELIADAVREYGTVQFRVHGVSMRPMVRSGDVLHVERESMYGIRFGEVAVFMRGGGLFAHRVIGKKKQNGATVLITKGDAFPQADSPVSEEELLGRVTCVKRGQRKIFLDGAGQQILGKLAASVSICAPAWYPSARAMKRMFSLLS